MAFNLAALGAGFGQFAEYMQRQQQLEENKRRNDAMLGDNLLERMLKMRQLQEFGIKDEAAGLSVPSSLGGGGASSLPGSSPMAALPLPQAGGAMGMPQMGQAPAAAPNNYGATGEYGVGLSLPGSTPMAGFGPNVANNNFAGMRQPGVPAGGGPMSNPAGWQKFGTPEEGINGISRQLDRYASGATTGQPLTTLRQMVTTWAPPSENPTEQLIARASAVTGFAPDQPLDMSNPAIKSKVVEAMMRNEHGGRLPVEQSLIGRTVGAGGAPAAAPQMAQAAPAAPPVAGASPAAPAAMAREPVPPPTLQEIIGLLHKESPRAANRALTIRATEIRKDLLAEYKTDMELWKTREQLGGDAAGRAQTAKRDDETNARGRAGLGLEGDRNIESVEARKGREANEKRQRDQEDRSLGIRQQTADAGTARAQTQVAKQNQKTQMETLELDTLANEARQLAAMAQQVQQVTGARGMVERVAGSALAQVGMAPADHPVVADFKSKLQLLQSRLAKPLMGARYFSGPAQKRMNELVPGLGALDDVTKTTGALLNVAELLEGTSAATKQAGQAISEDVSKLSDADLLRSFGAEPKQ